MSRIALPTAENIPAASQPILEAIGKKLGMVPNLYAMEALSTAALEVSTAEQNQASVAE